jgi:hypothetical protein
MKSILAIGAVLLVSVADNVHADTVSIAANGASSWNVTARARNGRSGFEGQLSTPGSVNANMNPGGAPVWAYGSLYNFRFTYTAATGQSTWSIDFNRDNDFADAQESVSTTTASLAGQTFSRASLYLQGNANASVSVTSFNLNGFGFGPFSAGNGVTDTFFQSSSGQFGDIIATGNFSFSANGGSDEMPRLWLRFGDAAPLTVVPLPPAAWAGLGALGTCFGVVSLRRRRNNAAE